MLFRTSWSAVAVLQVLITAVGFLQVEGTVGFGPGEQEWDYVSVRPFAHMFWWLHYTTSEVVTDVHEKPLLIWLQGGTGPNRSFGNNIEDLGPLDLDLKPREHSWGRCTVCGNLCTNCGYCHRREKDYNVLYIDSPVGAGFSLAESVSGYATNNAQIAADLLECIRGFLDDHPKFADVPTYITAKSYNSKSAAEFALVWYKAQKTGNIRSNLQGVALGEAFFSPVDTIISLPPFLHEAGLVDTESCEKLEVATQDIKRAVDNGEWTKATELWIVTQHMILELTNTTDRIANTLSKISLHEEKSVLQSETIVTEDHEAILEKLMNTQVKEVLGVDATWNEQRSEVFFMLTEEFMKPATNIVEQLISETDLEVFIFTGLMDLEIEFPGSMAWIENCEWSNLNKWYEAPNVPLVVGDTIEGYVKEYGNFKVYWIDKFANVALNNNPAGIAAMLEHLTAKATFKTQTPKINFPHILQVPHKFLNYNFAISLKYHKDT